MDASAAVAYLLKEPGGQLVRRNLSSSIITSVNLIEAMRRLRRELTDAQVQKVCATFTAKIAGVEDVIAADVLTGARIYADYQKSHNISLGDAVCLAVGLRLGFEVWTTNLIWAALPDAGKIKVIR